MWECTYTGLRSAPRDYSLKGTKADRTFNAIGALATIAFAYNTGILPEMQVCWHSTVLRMMQLLLLLGKSVWQEYYMFNVGTSAYC
jgi:hypothetical protein